MLLERGKARALDQITQRKREIKQKDLNGQDELKGGLDGQDEPEGGPNGQDETKGGGATERIKVRRSGSCRIPIERSKAIGMFGPAECANKIDPSNTDRTVHKR